ncbi:MAG: DUF1266 domain-containing protein [Sphingomonas sp.]
MAQIRVYGARRPFASAEQRWAYAIGAPYHVAHGYPGDGLPEAIGAEREATMLQRDWGITDRTGLIAAMTHLGDEGHRHRLGTKLRYYSMIWRPAVASLREELRASIREGGDEAAEAAADLWRLDAVQADLPGIRSSALLAFDAARGIMLARDGLLLGWLEEDEAWPYMLEVARDVRRSYASWQAFGADFILSRNVWAGDGEPDTFDAVIELLNRDQASPWRTLPWGGGDLPIPAPVRPGADLVWTLERR